MKRNSPPKGCQPFNVVNRDIEMIRGMARMSIKGLRDSLDYFKSSLAEFSGKRTPQMDMGLQIIQDALDASIQLSCAAEEFDKSRSYQHYVDLA